MTPCSWAWKLQENDSGHVYVNSKAGSMFGRQFRYSSAPGLIVIKLFGYAFYAQAKDPGLRVARTREGRIRAENDFFMSAMRNAYIQV